MNRNEFPSFAMELRIFSFFFRNHAIPFKIEEVIGKYVFNILTCTTSKGFRHPMGRRPEWMTFNPPPSRPRSCMCEPNNKESFNFPWELTDIKLQKFNESALSMSFFVCIFFIYYIFQDGLPVVRPSLLYFHVMGFLWSVPALYICTARAYHWQPHSVTTMSVYFFNTTLFLSS